MYMHVYLENINYFIYLFFPLIKINDTPFFPLDIISEKI